MRSAAWILIMVPLLLACLPAAESVFNASHWTVAESALDRLHRKHLASQGLRLASPCSDAVFLRRAGLDLNGRLPTVAEVTAFLADRRADKRERLVEDLLRAPAFADVWTMRWADILRVKAEFPINLWPNGVQAYDQWLHQTITSNQATDAFFRDLLTASGSNFRVPPVNFYRAIQGKQPATIAAAVALTTLGSRLEHWPQAQRDGLVSLFSYVVYKGTAEWKEEFVLNDPEPHPGFTAMLPDGSLVAVGAFDDPRQFFCDWLLTHPEQGFARAQVNRIWAWLFGRGLIHPVDDIRLGQADPSGGVLSHLEQRFIELAFDRRALISEIVRSRTYQQSAIPETSDTATASQAFACYPLRRLEAEVLRDAVYRLTGYKNDRERFSSQIPEPFTYLPPTQRTVTLADGSITGPFLELFGRPSRDTGLAEERSSGIDHRQRLHLINSTQFNDLIMRSPTLRRLIGEQRNQPNELINTLYLAILSRHPTESELSIAHTFLFDPPSASGNQTAKQQRQRQRLDRNAAFDLCWTLLCSKEFLYKH